MTVLFISDLHLDPARPAATETFLRFLADDARQANRLYILGDLFEAWLGDDDPDPHHARVKNALADFTRGNQRCFFIAGNRDFLIGPRFAKDTGVTVLPDHVLIEVAGTSLLILHGDTLCTDDTDYQRARRIVRHPATIRFFNALPLSVRLRIAASARRRSQAHTQTTAAEIMDVNQEKVIATLAAFGVDNLLHGHTHRPAEHRLEIDGREGVRIVLPAWETSGHYLRWDAHGRSEHVLPFDA